MLKTMVIWMCFYSTRGTSTQFGAGAIVLRRNDGFGQLDTAQFINLGGFCFRVLKLSLSAI